MFPNDDNDYVNDKYSEMTMTKRRVDPVVSDTPVLWFICPMLGDSFFCSLRGKLLSRCMELVLCWYEARQAGNKSG